MKSLAKLATMERGAQPRGIDPRVIWIVAAAVLLVLALVGVIVGVALTFATAVFRTMDRTEAHVCGLAAMRRSPAAIALVGTPMAQRGLTGGSWSSENGELRERVTFTVSGPRGSLFVRSEGMRSELESHLEVRAGRNGNGVLIYSGPFDCPELRARKPGSARATI